MTGSAGSRRVRGLVARAFRGSLAGGVAAVIERLAGSPAGAFAVLTYHRVDEPAERPYLYPPLVSATPAAFEAQMVALIRRHRPIGLPELLAAHRGGRGLPSRAVLVTFDDAYRDFLDNAWPVLARHGIPVTLFVPTAFPDATAGPFWWDEVWQAVRAAPTGVVDSPIGPVELADDQSRRTAASALVDFHKSLDHDEAMSSVAALVRRLGGTPARPNVLEWAEIRRLATAGVHVAPHSRTHPLLTRLQPDRMREELLGSRHDLERHLGPQAFGTVFAYPAGQHSPATESALASLGFELAFTTERGTNRVGGSDPLRLRRINVGLRSGPELIRAQQAFFTLRYRLRGV